MQYLSWVILAIARILSSVTEYCQIELWQLEPIRLGAHELDINVPGPVGLVFNQQAFELDIVVGQSLFELTNFGSDELIGRLRQRHDFDLRLDLGLRPRLGNLAL